MGRPILKRGVNTMGLQNLGSRLAAARRWGLWLALAGLAWLDLACVRLVSDVWRGLAWACWGLAWQGLA